MVDYLGASGCISPQEGQCGPCSEGGSSECLVLGEYLALQTSVRDLQRYP
jgi:hypothetical protein